MESSFHFLCGSNTEAEPILRSLRAFRALSVSSANFKIVIMLDHIHESLWNIIDRDPASVVHVDIAVTALSVVFVVVLAYWAWFAWWWAWANAIDGIVVVWASLDVIAGVPFIAIVLMWITVTMGIALRTGQSFAQDSVGFGADSNGKGKNSHEYDD